MHYGEPAFPAALQFTGTGLPQETMAIRTGSSYRFMSTNWRVPVGQTSTQAGFMPLVMRW